MEGQVNTSQLNSSIKIGKFSESLFKTQNLPAFQPSNLVIIPILMVLGLSFIVTGSLLIYFTYQINEKIIDYTHCSKFEHIIKQDLDTTCAQALEENVRNSCECRIHFTLKKPFTGEVFMYYKLSNFYQNSRRYVSSRDDEQLFGQIPDDFPSVDCAPFDKRTLQNNETVQVVPCGSIANSLFNDTFKIKPENEDFVELNRIDIAWDADKEIKFRNPQGEDEETDLKSIFSRYLSPEAWTRKLWELDPENPNNNGLQNEDLIVWMRTAALPNFQKLHRRILNGLKEGEYTLFINYKFPVVGFDGRKAIVLSEKSVIGGRNSFIGYAYIVVGSVSLILSILLVILYFKRKSTIEQDSEFEEDED